MKPVLPEYTHIYAKLAAPAIPEAMVVSVWRNLAILLIRSEFVFVAFSGGPFHRGRGCEDQNKREKQQKEEDNQSIGRRTHETKCLPSLLIGVSKLSSSFVWSRLVNRSPTNWLFRSSFDEDDLLFWPVGRTPHPYRVLSNSWEWGLSAIEENHREKREWSFFIFLLFGFSLSEANIQEFLEALLTYSMISLPLP